MGTLYHCPIDGRTVLFDVVGDRYFLVPEPLQAEFDGWLADEGAPVPAFLTPLLARRDMSCDAGPIRPDRAVPASWPNRTLERGPRRPALQRVRASLRWQCMTAQVRSELADLGLAGAIERVRFEKLGIANPCDPCPIAQQLRADQRHRLISGDCLVQSLAMMRALHHHQSTATLVFGVTLDPFRAHCWVQHESYVLNDEIDTVASYCPILTL